MNPNSNFYQYALDITGLDTDLIPLEKFHEKIKSLFKFDDVTVQALIRILREKELIILEIGVKKRG
jgi:predicted mannosyl-3-phosphoglycerate phosphatase (HAD superfamily)